MSRDIQRGAGSSVSPVSMDLVVLAVSEVTSSTWDIEILQHGGVALGLVVPTSNVLGSSWDIRISWWITRFLRSRVEGASAVVNWSLFLNVLRDIGGIGWALVLVTDQGIEEGTLVLIQ